MPKRYRLCLPAVLLVLLPGCFAASGLPNIRDQLEREVPEARFKRQIAFTVGPMSLGLAKLVSRFVPSIQEPRAYFKQVHKVKMAVYENRSKAPVGLPRGLRQAFRRQGWETLVRVNEPADGSLWVLYRTDGGARTTIDTFYILALDEETMVLVELEASLDRILERALSTSRILAARDPDHQDAAPSAAFWHPAPQRLLAGPPDGAAWQWEGRNTSLPDFWEVEPENLHWRYNRVEGLYLGWRTPRQYAVRLPLAYYGQFGYGFHSHTVDLQAGGELFPWSDPLRLGGEVHDQPASQDQWVISPEENNLSALFFKRDLRDYYRRWGGSLYISRPLPKAVQLTARLAQDTFESLDNAVTWSVFGGWGRSRFRPNPAVDEVRLRRLEADLVWDTRDRRLHPRQGWLGQLQIMASGRFVNSGLRFRRLVGDVRRYQMLGGHARTDLRLRLGGSTGTLPRQYLYNLGGFSSLRGYRFKEFSGDRMALFNGEIWLDGQPRGLGSYLWDGLNVGAFFDLGAAWFSDATAFRRAVQQTPGSRASNQARFKASAGMGLDFEDIRLYLARPLETGADWQLSMRLSRSF